MSNQFNPKRELISLRRYFHRYPELSGNEINTQKYIIDYFEKMNVEIIKISRSVLIYFDFGYKETYAFRAEEDALKILEQNSVEYKSLNEGIMHACGHDGHMAILMCLGKMINLKMIQSKRNVLLIFQSQEETSLGAIRIIDDEKYKKIKPSKVFALHLYPSLEEGKIFSCEGPFLSSCVEVDFIVEGKESHTSKQNEGKDAIKLANKLLTFLYRYLDKQEQTIYLIGKINGGSMRNIVSSRVNIEMTLRNFNDEIYLKQKKDIIRKIKRLNKENPAKIKWNFDYKVPMVVNDKELYDAIVNIVEIKKIDKQLIGDEFSYYDKESKILYVLLGIDSDALHTSTFNFNEVVLLEGLNYFTKIIES